MNKRIGTLFLLVAAIISGTLLFQVSQDVQQSQSELRSLKKSSLREAETIRVLSAEWDYLNRPARLESLAAEFLQMDRDIQDNLLTSVSGLNDRLPGAVAAQVTPLRISDGRINIQPQKKPAFITVRDELNFESVLGHLLGDGGVE